MKLFTIPITTGPHKGKELLGYNDFEATYFEIELNYGKEEYVIYNLSDITEEQAREFGFSRYGDTFKTGLKLKIKHYTKMKNPGEPTIDLSNILLILVMP